MLQAVQDRLERFPRLTPKDNSKLYELADLVSEIDCLKGNDMYRPSLAHFDSAAGVNPIINKLPAFMQNKWTDVAIRYKTEHQVMYPPFGQVAAFLMKMAERSNDPSFKFEAGPMLSARGVAGSANHRKFVENSQSNGKQMNLSIKKTNVGKTKPLTKKMGSSAPDQAPVGCAIHGETAKHSLKDCRIWLEKSRQVIQKHGICFKCCTGKHLAKNCKEDIKCQECNSTSHCTDFHINRESSASHGGGSKVQDNRNSNTTSQVDSKCTQICGGQFRGKSCAKTLMVKVYPEGRADEAISAYTIIDDQSNRSLARYEIFQHFNEKSEEVEYLLSSCAGETTRSGKRATNYVICSIDGTCSIQCSTLIECNDIPNITQEIPVVLCKIKGRRQRAS